LRQDFWAPSGEAVVTLASSKPSAAAVPPSVTVPTGQSSASFTISTAKVTAPTWAGSSASYGGATKTATLSIRKSKR